MPELSVNDRICTRCGLCVVTCPWRIIELSDGGLPHFTEGGAERCNLCGHCEAVCPAGAVVLNDPRLAPAACAPGVAEMEPERLAAYLRLRRSIRRYRDEAVDRGVIEEILDICRFAPTGRNRQDVHWLVIHDTHELRRLTGMAVDWMRSIAGTDAPPAARFDLPAMIRAWEEGRDPVCQQAPHLVVAHVHGGNPVSATNAVIALAHLEIMAPSFGLGACWGGIFILAAHNHEPLRAALGLPAAHLPVHALMLGYPEIRYHRPPKRKPACIVWR